MATEYQRLISSALSDVKGIEVRERENEMWERNLYQMCLSADVRNGRQIGQCAAPWTLGDRDRPNRSTAQRRPSQAGHQEEHAGKYTQYGL